MRVLRTSGLAIGILLACSVIAVSQSWQPLNHQPTFAAGTSMLLTDGTIMAQSAETPQWWKFTPDNTGSYVNGTWTQLASMPSNYGPLYFASAVLPDGRVIVEGGEYNLSGNPVWTNLGEIYDPTKNQWTAVSPPTGWANIGDAESIVLPNGVFMLADAITTQQALFNATNLTWTTTGSGKADGNDEEGWTLLQNGVVLTVDCNNPSNLTNSERYSPKLGKWATAGSTIVKLPDTNSNDTGSHEIGPAVVRPDGTVWATGATGATAVYTPSTTGGPGTWVAGPMFPNISGQLDVADGPASLLPSGNVLVATSPGIFKPPLHFFEFDGTSLTQEPGVPNSPRDPSFAGTMLLLPTGQVFFTDQSSDVEIYTPVGSPDPAWAPAVTSVSTTLTRGTTVTLTGTQLHGLSQASAYGDDAQMATNYPLVQIINNSTGHVFYARTHNHSTMSIKPGLKSTTKFDVPATIETGPSQLVVVANGIASAPVSVTVQ